MLKNGAVKYLRHVDDLYLTDAYHSLSIEGYRVNEDLIERVRSGYWQAFLAVKKSVEKVIKGNPAGQTVSEDHSMWYRELFTPSVSAGITAASNLAGYRNHPVYIRKSMHVPPRYEAVRDLMPAFFSLLESEDEPAVRAVLSTLEIIFCVFVAENNFVKVLIQAF